MGYRRRAFYNDWPGRGPFSHLPPWERPGYTTGRGFGRGRRGYCANYPWLPRWWWLDSADRPAIPTPAPQEELTALEESKKALAEEKDSIEQEIVDIETRVKDLKSKIEKDGQQSTQ